MHLSKQRAHKAIGLLMCIDETSPRLDQRGYDACFEQEDGSQVVREFWGILDADDDLAGAMQFWGRFRYLPARPAAVEA